MMTKKHSYTAAFQVYLPEELGFIDNVSAHIQIGDKNINTKAHYIGRYSSSRRTEWSKVFRDDSGKEITKYHSLKSSTFYFPIKIWDLVEGSFYLTFTANKDGNLTSYHTEIHSFRKSDKLICKKGFF